MMGSGLTDLTTKSRSSPVDSRKEFRVGALIAHISVSVNRMVVFISTNYLDEAGDLGLRF